MEKDKKTAILVVDDEPAMRSALAETLVSCGYAVETAQNGEEALSRFGNNDYAVIITDMRMPKMSGMEVLRGIKEQSPLTPVIIITAYGTVNTAVEAMKEGASDFIMKPFSLDKLESVVKRVIGDNGRTPETPQTPSERRIVTCNPAMRALMDLLKKVSRGRSSILIEGESGTGKEMFARYIHAVSDRARAPFVAVNCAAIPSNLLESEMFGYEKGAFTGAAMRKIGKFEQADGGSLLLDEISEMEVKLQAKLLRVIQESELDRLGGKEVIPVDVRIIATTNADLLAAIRAKTFREDLYYRLNVIPVKIPALRERRDDIIPLAEYFLEKYSTLNGIPKPTLTNDVVDELTSYHWPGNVRELENVIERSVLLCEGNEIRAHHLFWGARQSLPKDGASAPGGDIDGAVARQDVTLRDHEKSIIYRTLDRVGGNKTRASEILGISVRTIRNKLAEYRNEEMNMTDGQ